MDNQVITDEFSLRGILEIFEVKPAQDCSKAEAQHQHSLADHPNQGCCSAVTGPKMAKSAAPSRRGSGVIVLRERASAGPFRTG